MGPFQSCLASLSKKPRCLKSNNEKDVAFDKNPLGRSLPKQVLLFQIVTVGLYSRNLREDEHGLSVEDV